MNTEYLTISQYIEAKSKLIGKIATYDLLIEGMEKAILEATVSGHITQTEVDDGFMKVRLNYRSVADMTKALAGLEALRQRYINRYNGRNTVLRGGQF
jgi:hypothetical protein